VKTLTLRIDFKDIDGKNYTSNGPGYFGTEGESTCSIELASIASPGFENSGIEEQELFVKAMHNIAAVLCAPQTQNKDFSLYKKLLKIQS
jgi:hypothetical protein